MNKHGITKENLVETLPPALRTDPSVVALAESLADVLVARLPEIDRLLLYPAIDTLDEPLLDILAYDYKVDWWDPEYTLEEKRRTLKDSWRVHKLLGTKAAVVMAISAIYPHTKVLEWFEYGGEPYHFRLDINITNDSIDSAKQRRVLERLNFYKSLRSHNDGVTYFVEAQPAIAKAVASVPSLEESLHVPLVLPIPVIKPTAHGRVGAVTSLWESTTTKLNIPVPILQPSAAARVGVATGLEETFTTAIDIITPAMRSVVRAHAKALTGWGETFTARVALPDMGPLVGTAELHVAVSSTWQESYKTGAIHLAEKVLAVSAQAKARSAVASTQETAKTFINLC